MVEETHEAVKSILKKDNLTKIQEHYAILVSFSLRFGNLLRG